MQSANSSAWDKFNDAVENGESGKTVNVLGMELDAPIAGLLQGAYNEGVRQFGKVIGPKTYHIAEDVLGGKFGLKGKALPRTATVAAVGTHMLLSSGLYLQPFIGAYKKHRNTYKELAHALAPVIEDIRGNHSVSSLLSIKEKDNEMIYAHRQRLATEMSVENHNNILSWGVNVAPQLFSTQNIKGKWNGDELKSTIAAREAAAKAAIENTLPEAHAPELSAIKPPNPLGEFANWLWGSVSMGSGQIANYMVVRNNRKLEKHQRSASALEMVLELDKQVSADPQSSSFTMPGRHGRDCGLEDYIVRIMRQHQANMADISDQHAELREALGAEANRAAKRLAQAIRHGEISTLSLVRMIGEGHLIKKKGRAIATSDEVEAMVQRFASRQSAYVHTDPAEYYKDASFSAAQLKEALKSLDGKEKEVFAAMFPNEVLEEAGMSSKEVKAMRESAMRSYDRGLVEAIVGLNEKSDEALEKIGLASSEIQLVRDAMKRLEEQGVEAIKDLKTSVNNERGVEHLLTNAVVHNPKHLGTLMKAGRATLNEASAEGTGHAAREAERQMTKNRAEPANDGEYIGAVKGR
jgi:hypothetical protein